MPKKYAIPTNTVRIALAQINATVGDLSGNAQKIVGFIQNAKKAGAHMVVFPELSITGYPPEDLLLKPQFIDDGLKALQTIARYAQDIVVVIGFVDRDRQGNLFNAAAMIDNGKIKNVYYKNNLPNYGVFDEKRYFKKGEKTKTFVVKGICFGLSICEDIWVKNNPYAARNRLGVQVLLNLSASPYHCGKDQERKNILLKCAKEIQAGICYCNLIGGQDELIFDGGSLFLDAQGRVACEGKSFEQDLVICDVIRKKAKQKKNAQIIFEPVAGQARTAPICDKNERMYQALVLGTRDYLQKNGFTKAVLGVSGGIDSALVAAIAVDALGPDNVLGVSMPGPYTSSDTKKDAQRLAKNLKINFIEIPIKNIFNAYLATLRPVFKGARLYVTQENLQARIRGNLLMALSNQWGPLVLTTGNKSEVSVGYCTLYGDMAGGFAVIKDVPKTKVYCLADWVNKKSGQELIPQSIIRRPPTAELKKNQKDQDSLPAYDVLDSILQAYIEKDLAFSKTKHMSYSLALARKITNLVDHMEYKRRQAPPGIKITPKAFGRDRRLPITNRYRE